MSFAVLRFYRHLRPLQAISGDVISTKRACLHTTVCLKKDDEEKEKLVGPRATPKAFSKEQIISRAMLGYIRKRQKMVSKLEEDIAEYDLGRRHLANIMGLEDGNMSKEDVRTAIRYLLPSSLSNKEARPMMEHPLTLKPVNTTMSHEPSGRPNHYLYYTLKSNYYELMHKMALMYEGFKQKEDQKLARLKHVGIDKMNTLETQWIEYEEFAKMFMDEKITEHDYRRFILLLERIMNHPFGVTEKEFISKFRCANISSGQSFKPHQPHIDEDGRLFHVQKGARKSARAIVMLKERGSGQWKINDQDITYFTSVLHRQTILAPLQVCNVLDKYDITALVRGSGPSGQAGAIRLAVARALSQFETAEKRDMLRIAGLLTRDPRVRERYKPGQEGARKKFTWKRR